MFFLNADTASSIAVDMVETLKLWQIDVDSIAQLINSIIIQLVPLWVSSSGSVHTEKCATSVRDFCSYAEEASKRGTYSELTNNSARIVLQASSSQRIDPSASNAILKKDLQATDYAVETHRRSIEQSLMGESEEFRNLLCRFMVNCIK